MDEQVIAAAELARHGRDRPVDASTIAVLLTAITLATAGQLLLKAGMADVGVVESVSLATLGEVIREIATTWKLLAGLAAFALSSLFWLVALSRVPLSTAYPVVSFSYLLILGFSYLVLGERPTLTVWSGALLIMAGISLIGIGQR